MEKTLTRRLCGWLCPSRAPRFAVQLQETRNASVSPDDKTVSPDDATNVARLLGTLDDKIEAALAAQHLRLLSTAWLRRRPPGWKMLRRQELEALEQSGEHPYLSAEDAISALRAADRRIAVLSYGWLTPSHPDPLLHRISAVRSHVDANLSLVGLFWVCAHAASNPEPAHQRRAAQMLIPACNLPAQDFASLPQRPRSPEEDVHFVAALDMMCDLYASVVGTSVLQLKCVPARPIDFDGEYNDLAYEERGRAKAET